MYTGSVYTGHRRTLTKVSNGILKGLTDQGKTSVIKYMYYKLIVLLNKFLYEETSLKQCSGGA